MMYYSTVYSDSLSAPKSDLSFWNSRVLEKPITFPGRGIFKVTFSIQLKTDFRQVVQHEGFEWMGLSAFFIETCSYPRSLLVIFLNQNLKCTTEEGSIYLNICSQNEQKLINVTEKPKPNNLLFIIYLYCIDNIFGSCIPCNHGTFKSFLKPYYSNKG